MQRRVLPLLLLWATVLWFPSKGKGQSLIDSNQPDLPLDAKMRAEVIDKTLNHLMDNYVFPDVAEKMKKAIQKRQQDKEYDNIKTGQALARLLTTHLQEVSKDKHLRISCSSKKLPEMPKGPPPKEALAKMRERAKKMNGAFRKVERLPGNVGYMRFDAFMEDDSAKEAVAAAMKFLANTDALIIDLRYNGGGSPRTVALVCSYFFGEKPVHLNSLYWRKGNRTEDFYTLKEIDGPRYLNKDVFVLTSHRTFSGAEEFCYNLKNLKRATIVGETTGGGAHPGGGFLINDHFVMFVPTGRAINPITKTNWEGTGVTPDVKTEARKALDVAHQEVIKRLLARTTDDETKQRIKMELEREKTFEKLLSGK